MPVFTSYIALAGLLFFFYLGEQGKVKQLTPKSSRWCAYFVMWVFIGLRGHIMSDFIVYYPYFENQSDILHFSSQEFYDAHFEPGFLIYTAVFKLFCSNYFAWIAFNTLIDLVVLAWFFHRYCRSMVLPLIFFIAFNGILMEFNLYRNMKAIDCFLLSLPYLQQRRIWPYIMLNLLGFTFHASSLLYLPVYFILTLNTNLMVRVGCFVISNFIFLGNIQVISELLNNLSFFQALDAYDKVAGYTGSATEVKISIGYLERTVGFIVFSLYYNRLVKTNRAYVVFYNSFLIYYCCYLSLYEVKVLVERIPYLFMFSYWVLYPAVVDIRSRWRQVLRAGVAFLVVLKIVSSNHPAVRYENILLPHSTYEQRKALYQNYEQSN